MGGSQIPVKPAPSATAREVLPIGQSPTLGIYAHCNMAQPRQRRRRGYNQRELIAFLDAQERNVERIEPADDDIIAEFDPLNNPQESDFEQFVQIYDRIDRGVQQGRRTIRFRLVDNLESSLVIEILNRI